MVSLTLALAVVPSLLLSPMPQCSHQPAAHRQCARALPLLMVASTTENAEDPLAAVPLPTGGRRRALMRRVRGMWAR